MTLSLRLAPVILVLLPLLLLAPPSIADEDGESPAQPRGGQRGMWERMLEWDADGDGTITRDEFKGPERMWGRLDQDGDGRITKAEADKAMAGMRRGGRGSRSGAAPRTGLKLEHVDANQDGTVTREEWLAAFAAADADEDGTVSKEEFERFLNPPSRANGKAPAVGDAAPAVKAVTLDGKTVVDLAKPKRATVLVFGSWT